MCASEIHIYSILLFICNVQLHDKLIFFLESVKKYVFIIIVDCNYDAIPYSKYIRWTFLYIMCLIVLC